MTPKRKQSNNPNRTEENKDLFDYMEGKFSVWSRYHNLIEFKYSGNNMQESMECRRIAVNKASEFVNAMRPFNPNITFIEEDL